MNTFFQTAQIEIRNMCDNITVEKGENMLSKILQKSRYWRMVFFAG